jgi:hypothetical protein
MSYPHLSTIRTRVSKHNVVIVGLQICISLHNPACVCHYTGEAEQNYEYKGQRSAKFDVLIE